MIHTGGEDLHQLSPACGTLDDMIILNPRIKPSADIPVASDLGPELRLSPGFVVALQPERVDISPLETSEFPVQRFDRLGSC